jgi:hypothetical protein
MVSMRHCLFVLALLLAVPLQGQRRDSSWTIRAGSYQGDTVRLDLDLATRRKSAFLRVSRLKSSARYVGWNPSRFPAPVAFKPNRGITAQDSIAFWSIVNRMESDIGMRLFKPSTVDADADPEDIIVIDVKAMPGDEGMTLVTWSTSGGVYDARIYFRSPATLHNPRVVAHEMMHSLGFGHTTAWSSIMNPGPWSPITLTREDVAYAQYAFESRTASEREDMWERLALADQRDGSGRRRESFAECAEFTSDNFDGIPMTKMRGLAALGALSAIAACSSGGEKNADSLAASQVDSAAAVGAPDSALHNAAPAATTTLPANAPTVSRPRPPQAPPLTPLRKQ